MDRRRVRPGDAARRDSLRQSHRQRPTGRVVAGRPRASRVARLRFDRCRKRCNHSATEQGGERIMSFEPRCLATAIGSLPHAKTRSRPCKSFWTTFPMRRSGRSCPPTVSTSRWRSSTAKAFRAWSSTARRSGCTSTPPAILARNWRSSTRSFCAEDLDISGSRPNSRKAFTPWRRRWRPPAARGRS